MTKFIKNNDTIEHTWVGQVVAVGDYYEIQPEEEVAWCNNSDLLIDIGNTVAIVAESGDGNNDLTDINDAINFLKNLVPPHVENVNFPFADKKTPEGKKIYRRKHGVSISLTPNATTNCIFTVPYTNCKMNEVEGVGAATGDHVDIMVLDTVDGDISGIPNYMLNQFGFNVYLSPNHYKDKCNYDADLVGGMQLKIAYTNSQADSRDVFINFGLHEVVDS